MTDKTVARIGSYRIRQVNNSSLFIILDKGEKFGNLRGSLEAAKDEVKRRLAVKGVTAKRHTTSISTKQVKVQGTICYMPVVDRKIVPGDPLATRRAALKYAQIHANELLTRKGSS